MSEARTQPSTIPDDKNSKKKKVPADRALTAQDTICHCPLPLPLQDPQLCSSASEHGIWNRALRVAPDLTSNSTKGDWQPFTACANLELSALAIPLATASILWMAPWATAARDMKYSPPEFLHSSLANLHTSTVAPQLPATSISRKPWS